MNFISKSITRKLLLKIFVIFAVFASMFLFFYFYRDVKTAPFYVTGIICAGLLVIFLLIHYFDIIKPFKIVLYEIQSLLTGKPYKKILTNRVDEIGVLAYFFNQVTKGFGEVSFDIKDRERMLDELNTASRLQRDILPLKNPEIPGLQIVAKTKPASELGGDSFNLITIKDKTYVYIGDVTGHGVAAGLIMTMVFSLVSVFSDLYSSAYEIIVNVNKYIKQHVKKAMFMTMVMISWDSKNKKMTYVGAGHEHILVYRQDSGECEAILSGGIALGMVPDNSKIVQEKEIVLNDGDFIVLYTDGITEARNPNGELYGLDRLKNALKEYAPQYSAEGVHYHIAKDVIAFMETHPQLDDMTLIVIKRSDKEKVSDQSTSWKE